MKNQIKCGDKVVLISGKHKGSKGKVITVIRKKNQIIIENINLKTKHIKPRQTEEKGYIKKIEAPVHVSNVKITKNNI